MYQQQQQYAPAYTAGYGTPNQVEGVGSGGGTIQANEKPMMVDDFIYNNDVVTKRNDYENIL